MHAPAQTSSLSGPADKSTLRMVSPTYGSDLSQMNRNSKCTKNMYIDRVVFFVFLFRVCYVIFFGTYGRALRWHLNKA